MNLLKIVGGENDNLMKPKSSYQFFIPHEFPSFPPLPIHTI